jgi:hypothetical protein
VFALDGAVNKISMSLEGAKACIGGNGGGFGCGCFCIFYPFHTESYVNNLQDIAVKFITIGQAAEASCNPF